MAIAPRSTPDTDPNNSNLLHDTAIQKQSQFVPDFPLPIPRRKRSLRPIVQSYHCGHVFKKRRTSNSINSSTKSDQQHAMLAAKKLSLVLDLDHTLLHTVNSSSLEPPHEKVLIKEHQKDISRPQRHLFWVPRFNRWTKLRPGIRTFLDKANQLFELHICTMGVQSYAQEMAKLLDPTGALFCGRVVSKRKVKWKDLDDILGTESTAVIIDDTVQVWPRNRPNLIRAKRYTMSISHEREEDSTLASLYTFLERIHREFFSNPILSEVDVRTIIATEKRKVLDGCHVHISREFLQTGEAKRYLYSLCQMAQQFGVKCTTRMDSLVTHVLSNSLASEEAKWALTTGKFVVTPHWIESSALLYQKANEMDFLPAAENGAS